MIFLIIAFGLIYGMLAIRNFRVAAFLLICLFPAYLIRFNFGPLPSTILELAFGIFLAVWLVKYIRQDQKIIKNFFTASHWFTVAFLIFFAASILSIFTSDMWWYSFGQWRAYFLEPMILFVIFIGRQQILDREFLKKALSFSSISVAAFAIIQKLSGWTLPLDGRATSIYSSPNAVGLYLGPILILTLYLLFRNHENRRMIFSSPYLWIATLNFVAIYFTKSLGTVIALGGGAILFLWLTNYKRQAIAFLIGLIVAGVALSPIRGFIASKDQSSANRLILWQYSAEYLTASPQNFIFGTGIRQFFRKIQKPHYDAEELERLIYPHNIFLNFWTEIGLLGLLSFVVIYGLLITSAKKVYRRERWLGACLLSCLLVLFLHGLIDVPYFKNDLAMLFWTLAAVIVNCNQRRDLTLPSPYEERGDDFLLLQGEGEDEV